MAETEVPASSLSQLQSIKERLEVLLQEKAKSPDDPSIGVAEAQALFKTLNEFTVTFEMLRITGAGITVNNIKKEWNNPILRKAAKELIKKWRKCCGLDGDDANKKEQNITPPERPSLKLTISKRKIKTEKTASKNENEEHSVAEPKKSRKSKSAKVKVADVVDHSSPTGVREDAERKEPTMEESVRAKCRELLYNAILGNGDLPDNTKADPKILAEDLERCIYEDMKSDVGQKYRWRVNSRISNLKDPRNPSLRAMFLAGEITPDKLAKMTADEMACEELKTLRAKFTQEGISKALLVTNSGTKSDLLKCGKCHQKNCSYNQLQTRSSDEPMTTFAFCNTCGHRWKF